MNPGSIFDRMRHGSITGGSWRKRADLFKSCLMVLAVFVALGLRIPEAFAGWVKVDAIYVGYFQTGSRVYSSPAIGSDGTIYVGSNDKKLYAINSDGTKRWEFLTGNLVYSSPAIGSDGTIYVGSDDNRLYAFFVNGLFGNTSGLGRPKTAF